MPHVLVELMSQMTSLSDEEKSKIEESFPIKTFEKDSYLLKEGQIAKDSYLVIKGCIREYELRDGNEKTTGFYTENEAAANFNSIANQTPSRKNLVCTEETTLTILSSEKEQALYLAHPRFETFCRTGMEKMMGAKQHQLSDFIAQKPEERYKKLMEERSDLFLRVPHYHIASYLGITPETLSRIRKKSSGNG